FQSATLYGHAAEAVLRCNDEMIFVGPRKRQQDPGRVSDRDQPSSVDIDDHRPGPVERNAAPVRRKCGVLTTVTRLERRRFQSGSLANPDSRIAGAPRRV